MKHDTDKQEALKEHFKRFPGMNYTFVEGVNGRKNPFLRNSYKNRNIIDGGYPFTDGELGVLASHRMIMENCMLHTESSEPYWILIMEDDVRFHPSLTNEIFAQYIQNIPRDALHLKFGYLANPFISNGIRVDPKDGYKQYNTSWINFNNSMSFATHCYAIRSDVLPACLAYKFTQPLDCIIVPNTYGATNIEDITKEHPSTHTTFYTYKNQHSDYTEQMYGIAGQYNYVSSTI